MRLVATESALRDIEAIHGYIAAGSRSAADRFVRDIIGHLERLATSPFPALGRAGREVGTREIVHRPYVIVYALDGSRDELVVLSVVHGARRR